jgi:hypothetical protein
MRKALPWILSGIALVVLIGLLTITVSDPRIRSLDLRPVPRSPQERFAIGMMDATDLPASYNIRQGKPIDIPGAVAREVVYFGADPRSQPWVNVSQTMAIYPNQEASRAGYEAAVAEAIPSQYADAWLQVPELQFQEHADAITAACLPTQINDLPVQSCSIVALYNDSVMTLWGNVFEDRPITMGQFRRLLERVDRRMTNALPR